jgi:3-oxosteroid 1-dehydrogenase
MNMQSAWAAPVFYVPGEDRGRLCTIERALPGCIMVNQKGERYLNEAASYHVTGQQMAQREQEHGDASPSWMVFDYRYRTSIPMGPLYPLMPDWAQRGECVKTILKKGQDDRANWRADGRRPRRRCLPPLSRFNEHAAKGAGPRFPSRRGGL